MEPSTNKLLADLDRMDWFCNVGRQLESSSEVQFVQGWGQAMEVCNVQASKDARLEASNELSVQLSLRHGAAYSLWNQKVEEVKPLVEAMIVRKLSTQSVRSRFPSDKEKKTVLDVLKWDFLSLGIAHEYRHLVRTKYYDLLEYWYLSGHFPCGWIGEVPDDMENAFSSGKLAVF
jgi:hypothetical protein